MTLLFKLLPYLRRLGVLVCMPCLLLAGCVQQQAAAPLVIGMNAWPGYEFARLAREKGYYAAEGVQVKLVELPSLTDVRRAYERGQLDGMFSTVIEVLHARQGERKPVITLVTDYSDGSDVILALPRIKQVRGLRGVRVGLELGSLNTYLLARALSTESLQLRDVTLVNLPQNELAAAVRAGEVDAVVTYPPVSFELEKTQRMRRLFSSAEIPGEIPDVLSFEAEVLSTRAADVRAVLRAYARAQRFAREHPTEAYRIMAEQERVTVDEIKRTLESGIKLVGEHEQQHFFAPGGVLHRVVEFSSTVMTDLRQLTSPVLASGVIWSAHGTPDGV